MNEHPGWRMLPCGCSISELKFSKNSQKIKIKKYSHIGRHNFSLCNISQEVRWNYKNLSYVSRPHLTLLSFSSFFQIKSKKKKRMIKKLSHVGRHHFSLWHIPQYSMKVVILYNLSKISYEISDFQVGHQHSLKKKNKEMNK